MLLSQLLGLSSDPLSSCLFLCSSLSQVAICINASCYLGTTDPARVFLLLGL